MSTFCQALLEEELLRKMKTVFARHGAVPMSSKLLGYSAAQMQPNAAIAKMLVTRARSPEVYLGLSCLMQ